VGQRPRLGDRSHRTPGAAASSTTATGTPPAPGPGTRQVAFDGDRLETPIYAREKLLAGDEIAGPAIVEEFGSTVPIHPGFTARVDGLANLVVTAAAATHEGAHR
jgi:N-methylhydantoinase A/oxoprolinase/acetone carboxylase beta subunit